MRPDDQSAAQAAITAARAVVLGFAVAPLPPPEEDYVDLGAAGLLTAALLLAGVAVPWGRLPRSAAVVVPLAFLPIVALLRESQGGASSGYATLALLPVFWVALYGSRRDVGIVVAVLAVTFVVPIVTLGEPNYPHSEWRRAILWAFVSGFVGLAVNGLVGRERSAARETRRRAEELRQSEERFRQAFDTQLSIDALVSPCLV